MGLNGVRILLVEDENLIAMLVEDMLADLGCEVTARAGNIHEAIETARAGSFDCAILDVDLQGKEVFPVAEILSERGIPFSFASGYGRAVLPEAFRAKPVVSKPFRIEDLSTALAAALSERA